MSSSSSQHTMSTRDPAVVSPSYQEMYASFVNRVEVRKMAFKEKMRLKFPSLKDEIVDEMVEDVYEDMMTEVDGFGDEFSAHAMSQDRIRGLGRRASAPAASLSNVWESPPKLTASSPVSWSPIVGGGGDGHSEHNQQASANAQSQSAGGIVHTPEEVLTQRRLFLVEHLKKVVIATVGLTRMAIAQDIAANDAQEDVVNDSVNDARENAVAPTSTKAPISKNRVEVWQVAREERQMMDQQLTNASMEQQQQQQRQQLANAQQVNNSELNISELNNAVNNDQYALYNAQDNSVTTATMKPAAKNRTEAWRMYREEPRLMDQQLTNASVQQQQQQLANAQPSKMAHLLANTQQENNAELDSAVLNQPTASTSLHPSPPAFNASTFIPRQKRHFPRSAQKHSAPAIEPVPKRQKLDLTTGPRVTRGSKSSGTSLMASPISYPTASTSSAGSSNGELRASKVAHLNDAVNDGQAKHEQTKDRIVVKGLWCEHCGEMVKKNEYSGHLKNTHKVMAFPCPLNECGEQFYTQHTFAGHIRHQHKGCNTWPCLECPTSSGAAAPVFERCQDLKLHIRFTHQVGVFGCPVAGCDFEGEKGDLVVEHYEAVHREAVVTEQSVPDDGGQMVSREVPTVPVGDPLSPNAYASLGPWDGVLKELGEDVLSLLSDEQQQQQSAQVVQARPGAAIQTGPSAGDGPVMPMKSAVEPEALSCPWPDCKHVSPDLEATVKHVLLRHMKIASDWIGKEEPEESCVQIPATPEVFPKNLSSELQKFMVGLKKYIQIPKEGPDGASGSTEETGGVP